MPAKLRPTDVRSKQLADMLTTKTLRELLDETRRAMTEDDDLIAQWLPPKYGVRVYADFRWWANAIENALIARNEHFEPVDWTEPALPPAQSK